MSNSYSTSFLLPNPSSTVAGKEIDYQTPQRMSNSINYALAAGACHNVLSQSYADKTFIQNSSSFVEMSEWRIPLVSLEHNELDITVYYDIHGTSSACNARFTLTVGGVSAVLTLNLPSSADIASDTFSISFPNSDQYYGTLKVEVQADSSNNAEVEIKTIMASWTRLQSPVSAGLKNLYEVGEFITPFGTSRTGINQAFTSRFAHNMINNIHILRKRLRSYLNWSGCYNTNSTVYSNHVNGNSPEVYLGIGHIRTIGGYPLVPAGYDGLDHKKLELHVKYIGDSSNTEFDFFGNKISLAAGAGQVLWSIHTIEIDYEKISLRGDIRLPYYDASLDNTQANHESLTNYGNLTGSMYPVLDSASNGKILSINLMGI
tara:strand:+ start:18997 stop:20121 length:1125 start_codon:yes stop_codon:yes gene_type:complete